MLTIIVAWVVLAVMICLVGTRTLCILYVAGSVGMYVAYKMLNIAHVNIDADTDVDITGGGGQLPVKKLSAFMNNMHSNIKERMVDWLSDRLGSIPNIDRILKKCSQTIIRQVNEPADYYCRIEYSQTEIQKCTNYKIDRDIITTIPINMICKWLYNYIDVCAPIRKDYFSRKYTRTGLFGGAADMVQKNITIASDQWNHPLFGHGLLDESPPNELIGNHMWDTYLDLRRPHTILCVDSGTRTHPYTHKTDIYAFPVKNYTYTTTEVGGSTITVYKRNLLYGDSVGGTVVGGEEPTYIADTVDALYAHLPLSHVPESTGEWPRVGMRATIADRHYRQLYTQKLRIGIWKDYLVYTRNMYVGRINADQAKLVVATKALHVESAKINEVKAIMATHEQRKRAASKSDLLWNEFRNEHYAHERAVKEYEKYLSKCRNEEDKILVCRYIYDMIVGAQEDLKEIQKTIDMLMSRIYAATYTYAAGAIDNRIQQVDSWLKLCCDNLDFIICHDINYIKGDEQAEITGHTIVPANFTEVTKYMRTGAVKILQRYKTIPAGMLGVLRDKYPILTKLNDAKTEETMETLLREHTSIIGIVTPYTVLAGTNTVSENEIYTWKIHGLREKCIYMICPQLEQLICEYIQIKYEYTGDINEMYATVKTMVDPKIFAIPTQQNWENIEKFCKSFARRENEDTVDTIEDLQREATLDRVHADAEVQKKQAEEAEQLRLAEEASQLAEAAAEQQRQLEKKQREDEAAAEQQRREEAAAEQRRIEAAAEQQRREEAAEQRRIEVEEDKKQQRLKVKEITERKLREAEEAAEQQRQREVEAAEQQRRAVEETKIQVRREVEERRKQRQREEDALRKQQRREEEAEQLRREEEALRKQQRREEEALRKQRQQLADEEERRRQKRLADEEEYRRQQLEEDATEEQRLDEQRRQIEDTDEYRRPIKNSKILAEEQRRASEQKKLAEEQRRAREQQILAEEQQAKEYRDQLRRQQKINDEAARTLRQQQRAEIEAMQRQLADADNERIRIANESKERRRLAEIASEQQRQAEIESEQQRIIDNHRRVLEQDELQRKKHAAYLRQQAEEQARQQAEKQERRQAEEQELRNNDIARRNADARRKQQDKDAAELALQQKLRKVADKYRAPADTTAKTRPESRRNRHDNIETYDDYQKKIDSDQKTIHPNKYTTYTDPAAQRPPKTPGSMPSARQALEYARAQLSRRDEINELLNTDRENTRKIISTPARPANLDRYSRRVPNTTYDDDDREARVDDIIRQANEVLEKSRRRK